MAQRFVRCQLCGLPHPAEWTLCPTHQRPIVPAARVDPERSSSVPPDPPKAPRASSPSAPPAPQAPASRFQAPRPTPKRIPVPPPTPPAAAQPEPSLVGQVLQGRYQIKGVIARGGMGVVYDAMQLGLHRPVAVKCLHPRYAKDANALARFLQEARIVGAIGHPNVVEVFDLGALEDGAPFMVMERLVGESLAAAMRRERPMSVPLAVAVASQVLAALQATHARAVLHRDLKPDNVFLVARSGAAPLVKVLDFGVARDLAATADPRLTRAGFVMGTPAYMAPEQARGEPLDVRVDVYGVGALLYEMLTGRVPYTARTPAALLGEMLKGPVASPVHLRPSLPRALDEVVMRCLSFGREGRYADAAATLQALLSAGEDDDDAPTTLVEATPRVG